MVLVEEHVHPRSLDFCNQRKLVTLRDVHGVPFRDIAQQVRNLKGEPPSTQHVVNVYEVTNPKF